VLGLAVGGVQRDVVRAGVVSTSMITGPNIPWL
jgi:hypothetical protein